MLGGVVGGVSREDNDESSEDGLAGSGVIALLFRLLVLMWKSVVGSRTARFRGMLLLIG